MKAYQLTLIFLFIFISCKNKSLNTQFLNGYWIGKSQPRERNVNEKIIFHFHENKFDQFYWSVGHVPIHDYKIIKDSLHLINRSNKVYLSSKYQIKNENVLLVSNEIFTDTLYRIQESKAKAIILEITEVGDIEIEHSKTETIRNNQIDF